MWSKVCLTGNVIFLILSLAAILHGYAIHKDAGWLIGFVFANAGSKLFIGWRTL